MRYGSEAEARRAEIAHLRREATIDVKNLGFISSGVAAALEQAGVDVAQLERDLLDRSDINRSE